MKRQINIKFKNARKIKEKIKAWNIPASYYKLHKNIGAWYTRTTVRHSETF